MENVKGSSIEKRYEAPGFSSASMPPLQSINRLTAHSPLVLCQRVTTVRPELLLGIELCGLTPTVYRDTGDGAEVGFGQHATLRLPTTSPTSLAIEEVKQFGVRELSGISLAAVKAAEAAELSVLADNWQPRIHAAFAFAAEQDGIERSLSDLWRAFGGAYALIPKVTYVQVRGASYLCYLVTPSEVVERTDVTSDGLFKQTLERLYDAERLLASLVQVVPQTPDVAATLEDISEAFQDSQASWNSQVNGALAAIADGSLQKVVAARFSEHVFTQPVSLVGVLYALGNTHPDSTKFAFCGPNATFIGATPEHLISKVGQSLSTEALAGTTASSENTTHGFTPKEYHEHSPVLDAILNGLKPFCRELLHEVTPLPLRLPHVLHLRTAISGLLKSSHTHVLDLVAVLHPTPAVAGTPRQQALDWLAKHEDFERGWYAGPFGWFDAEGNGHFHVALRCGVLTQHRAVLFAGAGIVAGSVAEQEFTETMLKLKAMQSALSALPPTMLPPTVQPKVNGA